PVWIRKLIEMRSFLIDPRRNVLPYSEIEEAGAMGEMRTRSGLGEGSMIRRRLRILRHRASRWFLPPVRTAPTTSAPEHGDDAAPESWTPPAAKPVDRLR